MKKKGFQKETATKVGVDDRGTSTTLESNTSPSRLPRSAPGGSNEVVLVMPFVHLTVGQMVAYYTAVALGRDIDKPRALAKSVTVA